MGDWKKGRSASVLMPMLVAMLRVTVILILMLMLMLRTITRLLDDTYTASPSAANPGPALAAPSFEDRLTVLSLSFTLVLRWFSLAVQFVRALDVDPLDMESQRRSYPLKKHNLSEYVCIGICQYFELS